MCNVTEVHKTSKYSDITSEMFMLSRSSHSCVTSDSNLYTNRTVRHVACSLLYCSEPENPREGVIRKQILVRTANVDSVWVHCRKIRAASVVPSLQMASKTGRTWLDCKNPQRADIFFRLAVKVRNKKSQRVKLSKQKRVFLTSYDITRAWKPSIANWHLEVTEQLTSLHPRRM